MLISIVNLIAFITLVIGGVNWGLIGLFNFNLVSSIFGSMSIVSMAIYTLVFLSAIWLTVMAFYQNKKIMFSASETEIIEDKSYAIRKTK